MNERVWIAQANSVPVQTDTPLKVVAVVKPGSEQAITIDLGFGQKTKLDLSSIANEKMTMVHVGTKLIILFDNHSTVTIEPFFDSKGKPLSDLDVALGARDVTGLEFASLFPITDDQSVLPAAGNGASPASGADFHTVSVEAFSTNSPLALLGQENSGGATGSDSQNPAVLQDFAPTLTGAFSPITILEANLDKNQDGSDLATGARTGTRPNESGETATASGVTFTAGTQPMDVVFGDMAAAVVKDEAGNTLTVTWVLSPNGTHVEGFLPGSNQPAIIIQLGDGTTAANHTEANGTISPIITITLTDAFPHVGGATDNTITITGISVVGIDSVPASDGTRQSVSTTIEINITDDAPVLLPGEGEDQTPHVLDQIVGEDGLAGANTDNGSYDAQDNAGSGDVALNVDWGADDSIRTGVDDGRTLSFNMANDKPLDGAGQELALTSDGVDLQYVVTDLANGGQQLEAYRGDVHDLSTLIFTVTLDPTSQHGSYSFTLSGNLDHAQSGEGNDALTLDFGLTATDSDGDTVDTHFTVKVQDDTPTTGTAENTHVNEDDLFDGTDLIKETRTVHGDLEVHWGADDGAARHILMATDGLPSGLTSDGVAIDYQTTVDAAGNAVVMAYKHGGSPNAASDQVFSLTFSEDGSGTYTFRLLGNLDHDEGSDSRALEFTVDAYDSDGDPVTQTFTVDVADDQPFAIGTILTRTVEEEELPHGNEDTRGAGDSDFSVFGFPVDVTTAQAEGSLNIVWGADGANANSNGGFDGTQVAGDRSVVFGGVGGAHIDDGIVTGATVSQFLSVSGGSASLATLTSGGVALEYVLSGNGTVLTAYAGAAHDAAHAVFQVTLSDTGLGSYDFQLLGVLDHPAPGTNADQEDTLSFNFTFTARDGDGDIASNNFIVNIIDDSPVAATGTASKVEDESLPGGNNENETPNLAASVTGVSLNIAWGADDANPTDHGGLGDRSVTFTNNNVAVTGAYNGTVLTSLGQTVSYTVLSDGPLVGYTGSSAPTSVTGSNVVFYVSLSDQNSGEYSFTLVKPLDQAEGHGENNLTLTFNYTATDSDGDTSNSYFKVTVVDDVPTLDSTPIPTRTVEEEQGIVAGPGNEDRNGTGDADHVDFIFPFIHDDTTEKTTGSLGINWGADNANDNNGEPGDRSVQFFNVADPSNLTSRGEVVHYKVFTVNGEQTLVAYTGTAPTTLPTSTQAAIAAGVVFTVALSDMSAHGSYTFTLIDVLDQHGAGEDTLQLRFNYTATDSDGDTTVPGEFRVNVIDDTPLAAGTIAPRFVEEEELAKGNEDTKGAGDSDLSVLGLFVDVTTAHADGLLNIAWGGDDSNSDKNGVGFNGTQVYGDRSVVFGGTGGAHIADGAVDPTIASQFVNVGGMALVDLTSGGVTLSYVLSGNGTVLTAYAGDPALGHKVFTVTLSDAGNGSYNFELQGVLDHPVTGTSANQEDVLKFDFTFTARDSDGDIVQNNFVVNVIDDSPTITFSNLQKGAVDEDALAHGNAGDSYPMNSVPNELSGVLPVLPGNKLGIAGDIDATDTAHGTLGVNWGADDGAARTLAFDQSSLPTGLTSNHQAVHIWVSSDGATLKGYTGGVSSSEPTDPVFTVKLDASAPNGAYTFVLHHPLDESVANQEDSIDLTFGFIAKDSDGDTASSHFSVKVNDDAPTASYLGLQTVQESVNANGTFHEVTQSGTLPFHAGADGATVTDLLYRFSGSPNKVADADAATFTSLPMTSGGLPVTITTHTIAGGVITLIGQTTEGPVFTFEVTADGHYTYTQSGPIDHPDHGTDGSEAGTSDGVVLTFDYIVTDRDGDHATNAINIRINDSGPTLNGADTSHYVEEEQKIVVGPGNEDRNGTGDADHVDFIFPFIHDDTTQTTGGHLHIGWGADNANSNAGNGFNGTQVNGDRSVDFANVVANPTGLTSRGEAVHYKVYEVAGGEVLLAYTGDTAPSGVPGSTNAAIAANVVFMVGLSDAGDGSYTFTLIDVLDQQGAGEDTLELSFQYTATDSDGDTTTPGTFKVNVIDDTPLAAGTVGARFVEEEALGGGNEDAQPLGVEIGGAIANGGPITDHIGASLNIAWGGDDSNNGGSAGFSGTQVAGDRSVVFGGTGGAYIHDTDTTHLLTVSDVSQFLSVSGGGASLATLTSGGVALQYVLSDHGTVLTAYAGDPAADHKVFTVTLSDIDSGSYSFVLNGVLDHPTTGSSASQEDTLSFDFTFTARDSDGDIVQNNFVVNVIDDSPIAQVGDSGEVIEHGKSVALANGSFEADSLATGAPGVITDSRGNYTYSAPTGWSIIGGNGGLFAPINAISDVSQHSGDNVVWLRDGAVLAHDFGGEALVAGNVYTLHFNLGDRTDQTFPSGGTVKLIATDGTNSIEIASASLQPPADGHWRVVDLSSGPIDSSLAGYQLRIEIQHPGGTGDQILIDNVGLDIFTPSAFSGVLHESAGADGLGALTFAGVTDGTPVTYGSASTALTAGGQPVHYHVVDAHTLEGVSENGQVVFTVTLDPATGKYNFELESPIDHPVSGTDALALKFGYTITDGDGDTASSHFTVTITDDVPSASGIDLPTIQESVTASGDFDTIVYTGTLPFTPGADGATVTDLLYRFSGPNKVVDADASPSNMTAMTSGGLPVTITHDISGGFITLAGETTAGTVFTFKVNQADGSYTYTQSGPLDHPDHGIEGSETGTADGVVLTFDYIVTDGDNDHATNAINIRINDDGPVIVPTPANLIVNGSFEEGHGDLPDGQWSVYHTIPGWTSYDPATGPQGSVPFEIQVGNPGGVSAKDNQSAIELDSDASGSWNVHGADNYNDAAPVNGQTPTNATIQQTVATQAGQTYELVFWYAVRPGTEGSDSSGMTVLWNGAPVQVVDPTNLTAGVWQQFRVFVTGTGEDTLAFRGDGTQDSLGALLDNVSLVPMTAIDEDGLRTARGNQVDGHGDSQPGDANAPNSDGDDNEATATGYLNIKWGADSYDVNDTKETSGFTQDGVGRSVTFTDNNVGIAGGTLTSHGDDIVFSLENNGTKLVGKATHGDDERTVIEITLSDDNSGAYRVILHDALDHTKENNENDITLTFNYTATDADGDVARGSFKVLVDDDVPVLTNQTATSSVSEVDMFTLTTAQNVTLDFQHDTLSVAPNMAGTHLSFSGGTGIAVAGNTISNVLQGPDFNGGPQSLVLKADPGTTFTLSGIAIGVFGQFEVNSSHDVTIIAYDADNNQIGSSVPFTTRLVDYLGATPHDTFGGLGSTAISKLVIIPPAGLSGRLIVDNIVLATTTTTTTTTPHAVETVVDLTPLVDMGADSPGTWMIKPFASQQLEFTQGASVDPATYNGTPITISSSDGHTITGMAGGDKIFTLTLSVDGQATFELLKPIDGGTLRSIDFSQFVTVTDFDGDPVTLESRDFVINVNSTNHDPAVSADAISVDEAGLPSGSSHDDGSNVNTGTIGIVPGDGPSHVTIDGMLVTDAGQQFVSASGLGTLTITSITATAIGYSYELKTVTSGDDKHDSFNIVITDADHNSDAATLTIDIVDDAPVASHIEDSMGENDTKTIVLHEGTDFTFGADGAGTLTLGTFYVTGHVPASLADLDIHLSGTDIVINPGMTFDALNTGESSVIHISYSVTDSDGTTRLNEVTVTVNGVTDVQLPEAHDDHIIANKANANFTIPTAALLWNDTGHDTLTPVNSTFSFHSSKNDGGTIDAGTYSTTDGSSHTFTADVSVTTHDNNTPVAGTSGNDFVVLDGYVAANGYSGQVSFDGGAGNDVVIGTNGGTTYTFTGGDGDDFLYSGNTSGNLASLSGGDGNDWLQASGSNSILDGGSGNDFLYSTSTSDSSNVKLYGGDGNDRLEALGRLNILNGGAGDDVIIGHPLQTLTGGTGADTFVLTTGTTFNANKVTITDYKQSDSDKIDLSALLNQSFQGHDNSDASKFVQVASNGDLQIDPLGGSGGPQGSHWQTVATLQGVNASSIVDVIFENHVFHVQGNAVTS